MVSDNYCDNGTKPLTCLCFARAHQKFQFSVPNDKTDCPLRYRKIEPPMQAQNAQSSFMVSFLVQREPGMSRQQSWVSSVLVVWHWVGVYRPYLVQTGLLGPKN